ncbi:MAG: hypothetical protein ACE5M4_12165 [Anaerolineales bacterium]
MTWLLDLPLLLRGGAIGLPIAAPVGPIGVLCIQRTLAEGRILGLVAGLGAATADAGLGAATTSGNFLSGAQLVLGVFLGSALWWFLLSGGVSLHRDRVTPKAMRWVNWVSGLIIALFGVSAIIASRAG